MGLITVKIFLGLRPKQGCPGRPPGPKQLCPGLKSVRGNSISAWTCTVLEDLRVMGATKLERRALLLLSRFCAAPYEHTCTLWTRRRAALQHRQPYTPATDTCDPRAFVFLKAAYSERTTRSRRMVHSNGSELAFALATGAIFGFLVGKHGSDRSEHTYVRYGASTHIAGVAERRLQQQQAPSHPAAPATTQSGVRMTSHGLVTTLHVAFLDQGAIVVPNTTQVPQTIRSSHFVCHSWPCARARTAAI